MLDPTKWNLYANVAQVFATLFTGVTSIIAIRTLIEIRRDRSARSRPHLLFDTGGTWIEVEQVNSLGIPGVNPSYAKNAIQVARMTVTSTWRAKHRWGKLVNHGVGAALGAEIVVTTKQVVRSGERFEIDSEKLKCCPYEPDLNTIPASPSHIEPGQSAGFFRIPTILVLDSACAVSSAACIITIKYRDIYGNQFENRQSLLLTDERQKSAKVLFTIGDDLEIEAD